MDAPRFGAPRHLDDNEVERRVALAFKDAPKKPTHWNTRAVARQAVIGQSTVSRTWCTFGLWQHRAETFKLSCDPAFVDPDRDTVALHLAPPQRALVLRVDEKRQIEAAQGTATTLPMGPRGRLRSKLNPVDDLRKATGFPHRGDRAYSISVRNSQETTH
jgi:hypothetical protein